MVEIVRGDDLDAPDHTSDHRAHVTVSRSKPGAQTMLRLPDRIVVRPLPKLVKIF